MGLFSKKTEKPAAPPMPPAPDATAAPPAPGMPPAPGAPSMPPAPDAAPGMPPAPGAPSMPPAPTSNELPALPEGSNITPPSLPGTGLDDIKSQVVGDFSRPQTSSGMEKQSIDSSGFELPEVSSDEDLFNMFQVDDSEIVSNDSQKPAHEVLGDDNEDENDNLHEISSSFDDEPEVVDTHISNDRELNFETKKMTGKDETVFLTTTQFKALLEVVDSVKGKIKQSTETHIKLMDMKAEEDVEYESLRKNFQYIEDKLHDLDGILFND